MDKQYDIVTIGLMAYDMILRTVDETIFTRDATLLNGLGVSSGGGAMTQAVIASRLGCKTALVSKVGTDTFSHYLLEVLAEAGVDSTYIKISPTDTMMVTIALVRSDGTRNFLTWEGSSNRTFCLDDFDLSIVKKAKIVSYGSFYFLQGLDCGGAAEIFKEAKSGGAITIADAASDAFHQGQNIVLHNLPLIDYFIPSYEEARYLTGEADYRRMADKLLAKGCGNIIIKLGKEGCFAANQKESRLIPACHTIPVCDSTGAGDNFVGGFMTGLLDGKDIFSAARYGNTVASVSIGAMGAVTAVKNRQQIEEAMNKEPIN